MALNRWPIIPRCMRNNNHLSIQHGWYVAWVNKPMSYHVPLMSSLCFNAIPGEFCIQQSISSSPEWSWINGLCYSFETFLYPSAQHHSNKEGLGPVWCHAKPADSYARERKVQVEPTIIILSNDLKMLLLRWSRTERRQRLQLSIAINGLIYWSHRHFKSSFV